jgi:D-alanine-D-alanine ligase
MSDSAIRGARGAGRSERLRLGVLFGGRSAEHEVSVVSARSILREADATRFEVVPLGITRGGGWLTEAETRVRLASVEAGEQRGLGDEPEPALLEAGAALADLAALDVVFPVVHGTQGEDGTLQGLLELAGLPYVGSGVAASALGMDKALMRQAFATAGLPQPRHLVLRDRERCGDDARDDVEREIGYPCFVKPANGGSSVGVSPVRAAEELGAAVVEASRHDRTVLVEEALTGREVECAVLGNAEPEASPLGEIRAPGGFYSYAAKYEDDSAELVVPAEISGAATERVQRYALDAFRALDCAGLARVDFFVDEDAGGDPAIHVLELNTLPGFTPISMYPRLWQEAGLSYAELITRLVELALERHRSARARRGATDA